MTGRADTSVDERRCDGCGSETSAWRVYRDEGHVIATYCYGCDEHRERNGIEPGEHEQYQLLEE